MSRLLLSHRTGLLLLMVTAVPAFAQQPTDTTARPPARLTEVVSTAARSSQTVAQAALAATVLTPRDIAATTASTVPEMLLRLPGFTMRTYQASLVTGSSRNTASFRGMSGSGAGRALVLVDGVPINDAYNGFMRWGRAPLPLVDRVEVVRGGGSMIWGSRALGGVVNILTRDPARSTLQASVEGGTASSYQGTVSGTLAAGPWRAAVATDWVGSDGFLVTRPDLRGAIDLPNSYRHGSGFGRMSFDATPSLRFTASGSYFDQKDEGPTAAQVSASKVGELRLGTRWLTPAGGILEVRGFLADIGFNTVGVTASSDRTSFTPLREQEQDATTFGASAQWTQAVGGRHRLTAGLDLSAVDGTVDEVGGYTSGRYTVGRTQGGRQVLTGLFVQDQVDLSDRLMLQGAARLDRIANDQGFRTDTSLLTGVVALDSTFEAASRSRVNVSAAVRYTVSTGLTLRASGYTAFRAPTVYELFTPVYSSRGAVTVGNPQLAPERLAGGEAGADLTLGRVVTVRLNGFWNQVSDAIVDYTIGTASTAGQVFKECGAMPKGQTCRQRRNVAGLVTRGIESEVELQPSDRWSVWAAYTFNPTTIDAPGEDVDGLVARSAPRHIGTVAIQWEDPRLAAVSLETRMIGARFDDDLNLAKLEPFTVVGVRVSRTLWRGASLYAKVENLFDAEYEVTRSTSGYAEIGAPRWVSLGVRATW